MKKKTEAAAVAQLRLGSAHPFGALRGYVPLGGGEERIYRELRAAVPVVDAAILKLVRLCGGFQVKCRREEGLREFLRTVPCGRGQYGIDAFLSAYLDSLLTYGRAVGELVVAGERLRAVCWGDVTALEIREGANALDMELWGPDGQGMHRRLPWQELLLFTTKTCPNCHLAKEYLKDYSYVLIDAEENPELVEKYGIMQAPTLVVVNGDEVKKYGNASRIRAFSESL